MLNKFCAINLLDPTLVLVTFGTLFLAVTAAVVGTFAFLRKRSLVGDAIAHAILPGIAIAFMLTTSKNPFVLMAGALISGWLAMWLIEQLQTFSKLSADTSIALVLSVFFGFGLLLLTHIQHSGTGNQAGLDQFLFGNAAGMSIEDLYAYALVGILLLITVLGLYKELMLFSFNPDFAQASGLPVKWLRRILNSLTVLAIAIGIQSVGVVLMAALLITPAAAARAWSNRLSAMIGIAAATAALSAVVGSWVSYSTPNMPTGPWVVMSLSFLALGSLVVAPQRGLLARLYRQKANRQKILRENLLKTFYKLGESAGSFQGAFSLNDLKQIRDFTDLDFKNGLRLLLGQHYLLAYNQGYKLTRKGLDEARRVVRLHRLWEMYLTQRMRLKSDHIHPNAETIEHIITPEIEEQLLRELNYPAEDPHSSPIPYQPWA